MFFWLRTTKREERIMPHFRIKQGGATVAQTAGQGAEQEIMHLCRQYRQDGPLTIQRRVRSPSSPSETYWKRHMAVEKYPIDGLDET